MTTGAMSTPLSAVLKAIAVLILLFLAVYIPAFFAVGLLRLSQDIAVPAIILATLAIAWVLVGVFSDRHEDLSGKFGFQSAPWRYFAYALAAAVPLAALITWALNQCNEPGPLAGLNLAPMLVYLYFVVGAPVQEEVIFRGLLQTVLARNLGLSPALGAASGTLAMLLTALLFGAIHLVVGPATAAGALVLGILAGLLKQRSGSLLPAILCHSIFNLAGILWGHN